MLQRAVPQVTEFDYHHRQRTYIKSCGTQGFISTCYLFPDSTAKAKASPPDRAKEKVTIRAMAACSLHLLWLVGLRHPERQVLQKCTSDGCRKACYLSTPLSCLPLSKHIKSKAPDLRDTPTFVPEDSLPIPSFESHKHQHLPDTNVTDSSQSKHVSCQP